MPALAPLLASETEIPGSPAGEVSKKIPRKLRRKNPPPSLSTNHQKLPSATSSTVSLPKSRPSSSRSTKAPSGGGWFSRASITGGRKSMDTGSRNEWQADEFRDVPSIPYDIGLGSNVGHGGVLTPPGSPTTNQGSLQQYIGMDPGSPSQPTAGHFDGASGKIMTRRPSSSGGGSPNGFSSLPPPPIPPRPESLVFKSSNEQSGIKKLSEIRPKAKSVPIDNEFLLPPTAPFAGSSPSEQSPRPSNGSPILPPLPSFRSGDLGFVTAPSSISSRDSLRQEEEKPPLSPKHPGRKAHSRSASRSPQRSETTQPAPKHTPLSPLRPYTPPDSIHPALDPDFIFHAVTAEEPIVLPSTPTQSSTTSPSGSPLPVQPEAKKKERRGSFLGGWKLAMKKASGTETGRDTPINDPPVGVGSGGGWIYRRRGSFSSPRPPSAEKMQHKTYAQEYKEFRQSKGNNSSVSSKSSTTDPSTPATASTFAARAAAAGIQPSAQQQSGPPQSAPQQQATQQLESSAPVSSVKPSRSTRKNFREKMKSVEARFTQKHPAPAPPKIIGKEVDEKELVGLDVAVRQMGLLEEQLKSGRPLSPPDSREGEKSKENEKQQNQHDRPIAPLTIVKTNSPISIFKEEEKGSIPSPTSSPGVGRSILQPAPSPSNHTKTKTLSPLRNQVDTSSPLSPKIDKGKAKEGDGSIASSKYSSSSIYSPPPSEYLGKYKTSSGGVSRPPTPPKPVAKLFVICCRCKVCIFHSS